MIHQWCPFSSVLSVVAPPGGGRDDKDDNEKAQADTANNNKNDNDNDDDPHRKRQQQHKRLHLLARGVAWSAWMGFLLTQGVLGILWWFGSQADKNDKVVEESQGGVGIRIWIATTSSSSTESTNHNWVRLEESPSLVQGLNLFIMAATFYIPLTAQLLYSMALDCRSRRQGHDHHSRTRTTTQSSSWFLPWSASRVSVLLFWCGAMLMGVFQQGLSAALGYMLHLRQGIMEEKEEQQEAGDTATILLLSTHLSVMAWIFWVSWIPVLLERMLHYTCFYQAAMAVSKMTKNHQNHHNSRKDSFYYDKMNDTDETEEEDDYDDTTESSSSSSNEEQDQDFFLREKQHELHQRLL